MLESSEVHEFTYYFYYFILQDNPRLKQIIKNPRSDRDQGQMTYGNFKVKKKG